MMKDVYLNRDGKTEINTKDRMTTNEYQALIKTLTLKERFELNQRIRDDRQRQSNEKTG